MPFGEQRPAGDIGDPDAMLARFVPAPGRTARVVLHPRLSFVPCEPDAFDGVAATFEVDVAVRVCCAADVQAAAEGGAPVAERAAAYDAAIEEVAAARARQDAAAGHVDACERKLRDARANVDRVAHQRAQADEAILAAQRRLALLEGGHGAEGELRRELEAAHSAATIASDDLARIIADATTGREEQIRTAEAALARAEQEIDRIVRGYDEDGDGAVDGAAHRLELWAAQRSVEGLRSDLERLRASSAADDGRDAVEVAQRRVDEARARVAAAERALGVRADGAPERDAVAEASAIRAQIDAVQRSLADAADVRNQALVAAERDVEAGRREFAATQRALAVLIERVEPGADARDLDGVAGRLHHRRAQLETTDSASPTLRVLRRLAEECPEPLLVLVEPFPDPPEDLLDSMIAISGLKRIAFVTENTSVLQRARELDPAIGAVRQPLDTGGVRRQEMARSDGMRS
jgi:hypothetical protein